jgi:hypothetical protein
MTTYQQIAYNLRTMGLREDWCAQIDAAAKLLEACRDVVDCENRVGKLPARVSMDVRRAVDAVESVR